MHKKILFTGLLFWFFSHPAVAAPSISNIVDNRAIYSSSQIPKYEKLEINFNISNTVAKNLNFSYAPYTTNNPYPNANNFLELEQGITVDGQFLPPGETDWNKALIQPAFYYQDFIHETHSGSWYIGVDWYYPNGNYSWKIRFAPTTTGNGNIWKYRIVATDASGSVTSSEQSFTVTNPNSASSSRHGFVRVSSSDKRYFELEDGTYFPGLGYNMNYDQIQWVNPEANVSSEPPSAYNNSNPDNLQKMGQNGIQFIRIWLSQWSIYGAGWTPWKGVGADYDPPWTWLSQDTGQNPASEFSIYLDPSNNPTMTFGVNSYQLPVNPSTSYRIRLNYQTGNITGSGGFIIKPNSNDSLLPYVTGSTSGWQTLDRTYTTTSNQYYLNGFTLAMENASGGWAKVRSVAIQETLPNNQYGPNIVPKSTMDYHLYFDQRQSYGFDQVVELAKTNGVYLRPVILDHREETLNTLDTVYGNYDYSMSRGRWLETQWYRYLQARWGYSTAIHSWEFVNEGDPGNSHSFGADYLGRYMHGHYSNGVFDANKYFGNWHISSTSVWTGSTADWNLNNYPDIDFADFHQYIAKSDNLTRFNDTALATYDYSMANTGAGRPVVRGETGFTDSDTQPPTSDQGFLNDVGSNGIWLHNFLWGGINSGGLYDSGNWYAAAHIYPSGHDHRDQFKFYYNFIKDVPLLNGNYIDAATTVSNTNIRAWGQKDSKNNPATHAHLWIANVNYRWNNQNPAAIAASSIIQISGFTSNTTFPIQWWDTFTGTVKSGTPTSITSDATGKITLTISTFYPSGLVKDFAVKIGNYTTITPTPLPSATTCNKTGDVNADCQINAADLKLVLGGWLGTGSCSGFNCDLNSDARTNALDATFVIANWGK